MPETNLYGGGNGGGNYNFDDDGNGGNSKKSAGKKLNEAVGQANQVRNVVVTIDAFNKGEVTINGDKNSGKTLTMQDVEDYFNDALMRLIMNFEKGN